MTRPQKDPPLFMTTKQLALLHVAKKQLGLDDDLYRTLLDAYGGVQSARDLDNAGFDRVLDQLGRLGFVSTAAKRNYGRRPRPGMASPNQVAYIRRLWAEWSDAASDDEAAIGRWLERHYGVSALRFLDAGRAQKAITGLKRMVARKRGGD